MAKKRKNRRNPAASARAASERVTYGGVAASARPVAKPPVEVPLPAPVKKKKSNAPLILASVFGVAVVGGVAWWLLSKKAAAAEAEGATSDSGGSTGGGGGGGYTLDKPFNLSPEMQKIMKESVMFKLQRAGLLKPTAIAAVMDKINAGRIDL